MHMSSGVLRRCLGYWLGQGVLTQETQDTYVVLEKNRGGQELHGVCYLFKTIYLNTGRFTITRNGLLNTFQNIYNCIQFYVNVIVLYVNQYTTGNSADEYTCRQSSKC